MIRIKRKKDWIDFLIPYEIIIDGKKVDEIGYGEEKEIILNNLNSTIQFKLFYTKTNVFLVNKDINTNIKIGSCLPNIFNIIIGLMFILSFIFMSFYYSESQEILYNIITYLGIFYLSITTYFSTFGYKKYLTVDINYSINKLNNPLY